MVLEVALNSNLERQATKKTKKWREFRFCGHTHDITRQGGLRGQKKETAAIANLKEGSRLRLMCRENVQKDLKIGAMRKMAGSELPPQRH